MWRMKWIGEKRKGEEKKGRVLARLTFGSSRQASDPGLRFLRSLKIPSSNFFMLVTGRAKASNRKTRARTAAMEEESKVSRSLVPPFLSPTEVLQKENG